MRKAPIITTMTHGLIPELCREALLTRRAQARTNLEQWRDRHDAADSAEERTKAAAIVKLWTRQLWEIERVLRGKNHPAGKEESE